MQAHDKVTGVAASNDSLYFATESEIIRLYENKTILVIRVPESMKIVSLAAPPEGGTLFFSTSDRIYALKEQGAVSIVKDLGGILLWKNDGLYALDEQRRVLMRLEMTTGKGQSNYASLQN